MQCQASGPYQMFEFLGDMVLFEQNQTTKVPHDGQMCYKGFLHGIFAQRLTSPRMPQITISRFLTGKHRIWGGPIVHWTKHSSGVDGALFA